MRKAVHRNGRPKRMRWSRLYSNLPPCWLRCRALHPHRSRDRQVPETVRTGPALRRLPEMPVFADFRRDFGRKRNGGTLGQRNSRRNGAWKRKEVWKGEEHHRRDQFSSVEKEEKGQKEQEEVEKGEEIKETVEKAAFVQVFYLFFGNNKSQLRSKFPYQIFFFSL